jgi:hypothetical protein
MRRIAWRVSALSLCSALLMGCGTVPPPKEASVQIPQHLLDCTAEPIPGTLRTDRELATYLLDLADAGEDCRQKLRALGGLINR